MKTASIALLSILLAPPLFADVGEHLIPAGSLIGCTLSEPRISSRTTAVGDPILCQVGVSERYGRSVLPYHSYLVGRFEDYKDPGHFVGKGWMVLKFDRMVIEPNTVIPVDARVVDVPGYRVDNQGRILGKGHEARDIALWSIPILWPIDLAMLPMRGPRPTLKEETRLTLKVMDDLAVPDSQQPMVDPYGLSHRQGAENVPPPAPYPDTEPAPDMAYAPSQDQQPEPPQQPYADAPPPPPAMAYAPPVVVAPPPVVAFGFGYGYGGAVVVPRAGIGFGYGPRYYAPGPRAYAYGYTGRGYAYGAAPRGYGYGAAPRAYGYGNAPRGSGYGTAQRAYAYAGTGYARGGYATRGGSGFRASGR